MRAGMSGSQTFRYADVDGLLKDLEIGPYAYLKDMSPRALIERHFGKVLAAAGFLLLLVLNELRLHALVRRRTRELAKAMNERERLAEEASAARLNSPVLNAARLCSRCRA